MWELVVFSIGKHFTDMGLLLCPAYARARSLHPASHVAAPQRRSLLRIQLRFTEMQNERISMLPYSILQRLIVSLNFVR
jgi:hypothetical protein